MSEGFVLRVDTQKYENYCEVVRASDGSTERYASVSGLETNEGDIIRVVTGNGGGLGDPKDRDPALVREDIKNGFLDPDRAAAVFDVTVE